MKELMLLSPIFYKDFYKVHHYEQYPKNTSLIFSNLTARKSRIEEINEVVFFGLQPLLTHIFVHAFKIYFFDIPKNLIMNQYRTFMKETLGIDKEWPHIAALHDLGYLPIAIHALPEGTITPIRIPTMVIYNTKPEFYWLTNMLETLISCMLWQSCTSATIARQYRQILTKYAYKTSDIPDFIDYQAHDFSFRGMSAPHVATISGGAHLLYFKGTDTIPAISHMHLNYDAPLNCGTSVPATEHSVMCAGGMDNELETFRRLITEIYPSGIVSIVSDSWDLWKVIDEYLPALKSEIMARDGKVVIRPDSGKPADIICGSIRSAYPSFSEIKGVIECLWDIFGGTVNSKGYRQLDPHIGVIYGDSITLKICEEICKRLEEKGFASTNIVFGIGSYTYQYNTRDTFGWAIKATYAEIDGKGVNIFKNPKTDDGTKKSATGLLKVIKERVNGEFQLKLLEEVSWDEFHAPDNQLKKVYEDGSILITENFEQVQKRARG